MRFVVEFDTHHSDWNVMARSEISQQLQRLAKRILESEHQRVFPIYDIQGNQVGIGKVEE